MSSRIRRRVDWTVVTMEAVVFSEALLHIWRHILEESSFRQRHYKYYLLL